MKRLYHYPAMFVLSLVSVIVLIVFEAALCISQVLFKPSVYSEAMGKYDIATTIYEDLDEYFEMYAAPTGIPKEVFTRTLDKNELSDAAYSLTADSLAYLTDPDAAKPEVKYDFTELENSVTQYVEEYSEENEIEKDDEYYSLIENTIKTAEEQIESRLDILMLYTLSQKSFAANLHKYANMVNVGTIVSAVILLVLIAVMCFINRHHPRDMTYWFGCILFCASAIMLAPVVYLDNIKFFDSFFVKSEHVYRTITGLFQTMLDKIINVQTWALFIGLALILSTLVIHAIYLKYREKKAMRRSMIP